MSKRHLSDEELKKDIDFDFFENEDDDKSGRISIERENELIINQQPFKIPPNGNLSKQNSKTSVEQPVKDGNYESDYEDSNSSEGSKSYGEKSGKSNCSIVRSQVSGRKSDNNSLKTVESSSESVTSEVSDHEDGNSSDNSHNNKSYVTNVSSLDSETMDRDREDEFETSKSLSTAVHSSQRQSRSRQMRGPLTSSVDKDMVSPEVILQAMLRIHEGRRIARNMKPAWVDPNTKDYSTSGITNKLNLLPQRMASLPKPPKKNVRDNPFYIKKESQCILYHTAINRTKELDRIERENMTIYSRLQRIQPSPGITRGELLREYSHLSRFNPALLDSRSRLASGSPSGPRKQYYSISSGPSSAASRPSSSAASLVRQQRNNSRTYPSPTNSVPRLHHDSSHHHRPSSRPQSRDATSVKRRM